MRQVWLYCGAICGIGVLISLANDPVAVRSQTPSARPNSIGMASCSSSGCHGAALEFRAGQESLAIPEREFEPPTWKNAANWWVRHDPHSKAYAHLSSKLSARIVTLLSPENPSPTPAWQDARCLACHSTPQSVFQSGTATTDLSERAVQLRVEGVSCDACHTRPGRSTDEWKRAHTAAQYQDEAYNSLGMRPLNSLADRVVMCAGCHVGAPADAEKGIPARNMNHDMIAAGHPRLNWDYSTYVDALPPHWQEYDRTKRGDKTAGRGRDWNLRMWLEGEVYSTAAALELTADRAAGSAANDPARPWPELAESNCYACHHELVPDSWRQTSASGYKAMKKRFPEIQSGSGLWCSTAYSLPLQKLTASDADLSRKHREFVTLMSGRHPDPAKVQSRARELRLALIDWSDRGGPGLGAEHLRRALVDAADEEYLLWDECVQIYNATRPILLTRVADGDKPSESIRLWNRLGGVLELPRRPGEIWNSPRLRTVRGDRIEAEFDKEFAIRPDSRKLMSDLFAGLEAK